MKIIMKKLRFLFAIVFIVATVVSCEKIGRINEIIRDDVPYEGVGVPIFELGNIGCEDVELAEGLVRAEPFSTGRINYDNGVFDGTWPLGLIVTVRDGKFVDFSLTEEATYCVGAVIVKGGNGAIVYKYSSGVRSDVGLTSPLNASGNPADLSNLTFCFVECPNDLVVVVKAIYWKGDKTTVYDTWAGSAGSLIPEFTGEWCNDYLGINPLSFNTPINLLEGWNQIPAGSFIINSEGLVTVTISPSNYTIDKVYIFVGTITELKSTIGSTTGGCPAYSGGYPWQLFDDPDDNSNVFDFTVVF